MGLRVWKTLVSISCCLSIIGAPQLLWSQEQNSNVTIEDATEEVRFERAKGEDGAVKVSIASRTTYLCNEYRISIPIVEGYSDQNKIDEVRIYTDGKRNKSIQPNFDYHEQEDIFYSDARLCHFFLPLEKKGATGEVVVERTVSNPLYFMGVSFADDREIKRKTVRISVPDWMSLELKEMNFDSWNIEKSKEQKGDETIYTYVLRNARALKKEPNSPGHTYYMPHVLALCKESKAGGVTRTYFKTVADQYAWYRSLVNNIGNDETSVKQKALEITAGKTSDEDKVKAIYHWVQQNIRYIAYEDGIAGLQPKKAQEVLAKKYGDCKGMGNLLKVMLRSLGYDARLCWLGTNHVAYDYTTPSLFVDNHMIAAWMRDGKPVFLDGTEKYIRFGETAERIQGRQTLIENGEGYLLERIPVAHYQQNTSTEERQLRIEGQDLKGKVTHVYKGEQREMMLSMINDVKLDRREEVLRRMLSGGDDAYEISNVVTSDINDYNSDLTVRYDLVHKGAVSKFGGEYYLNLDNRKNFVHYKVDTIKRKLPLCFPFKDHRVLDVRVELPSGARAKSLPQAVSVKRDDYGYTGQWRQQDGMLQYHSESWMEKTYYPTSQFSVLNKDVQAVNSFYNTQPELNF